ncbi:outer membrane or secreted lipoprotein [Noviherbaspirillum autotrophicum]|uniref:Outer membrane or secreted lipoprotein n=2 Tax=Noviherbaspirillum autotrophicum TaxID=709839 RepID=A0A0C1Y9F7_9BURK|nr:outer membrane or secreted lipoprotein [Noviherbaspirillum autotrophicum]
MLLEAVALLGGMSVAVAEDRAARKTAPPGTQTSAKTKTLEAGAIALQGNAPVKGFDIYLLGFHPMKEHPEQQMEVHHYCHQVNEDFAQCVLFDGNTKDANMNGIEYILSEKLFESLPAEERKYWHPHNGEILSGQLVAPGIPAVAEKALMQKKMNSYGKTWHFWNTGYPGGTADKLPLGDPMLAWSFNRDGEAMPGLVERRDRALDISTMEKRGDRAELRQLAHPQSGVDDLKGKFGRPTQDIPGVLDKGRAPPQGRRSTPSSN